MRGHKGHLDGSETIAAMATGTLREENESSSRQKLLLLKRNPRGGGSRLEKGGGRDEETRERGVLFGGMRDSYLGEENVGIAGEKLRPGSLAGRGRGNLFNTRFFIEGAARKTNHIKRGRGEQSCL